MSQSPMGPRSQGVSAHSYQEDAQNIAAALVSQRLAASVQVIGPLTSTYWWNGDVTTAEEWLCLIQTRANLFVEVDAVIQQVHPYDVPEVLAVPVLAGGSSYLAWLDRELKKRSSPPSVASAQSSEPRP